MLEPPLRQVRVEPGRPTTSCDLNFHSRVQKILGEVFRRGAERLGEGTLERSAGALAQPPQFRGDLAVVLHRVEAGQPIAAADKEAEQGIVVLRRDGIELVVVAAGTRDSQTKE